MKKNRFEIIGKERVSSVKWTNKGFTLVELIVVLVILAILAAILVPALLGWIDKARTKQDMLEAKNCMTAAQAEFAELYATRGEPIAGQKSVIPATDVKLDGKVEEVNKIKISNNDAYVYKDQKHYKDFSQKILKTAGYDKEKDYPCYLIIGAGNYEKYINDDPHKPYTIYFAMFQKTKTSKPIFYDGRKWTEEYPKNASDNTGSQADKDYNYYVVNRQKIRIQYYLLCNPNDKEWYKTLPNNATSR